MQRALQAFFTVIVTHQQDARPLRRQSQAVSRRSALQGRGRRRGNINAWRQHDQARRRGGKGLCHHRPQAVGGHDDMTLARLVRQRGRVRKAPLLQHQVSPQARAEDHLGPPQHAFQATAAVKKVVPDGQNMHGLHPAMPGVLMRMHHVEATPCCPPGCRGVPELVHPARFCERL